VLDALRADRVPAGDPARPAFVARLDRPASFDLAAKAKATYLVELLNAAADAAKLTPQTRLEVRAESDRKSANLPLTVRLPIGRLLARRRFAFRTDSQQRVRLSLRAVVPTTQGEGRGARLTYEPSDVSDMPVLLGDTVVAEMKFASRNLLLEGGAGSAAPPPKGSMACEVWPWTGGANVKHWYEYVAPKSALRATDGVIGDQETAWRDLRETPVGARIKMANAWVKFDKPQTVSAVAIYEDTLGPVPSGGGALERATVHYGVYAHEAKANRWRRVGFVRDNTDLINVFTFEPVEVDQLRYFWAGRDFVGRTDGPVRMAEIEAYSTEEEDLFLHEPLRLDGDEGGDDLLDDGFGL